VNKIGHRIAGFLKREGILERDEENSYLNLEGSDEDPMQQVLGCLVSYRIAIGSQQGRKVFTLESIRAWENDDRFALGTDVQECCVNSFYTSLISDRMNTAWPHNPEGGEHLRDLLGGFSYGAGLLLSLWPDELLKAGHQNVPEAKYVVALCFENR
jgi:hypothetical protein